MTSNFNQERANRRRSLSAAPIPYQLENTKSKATFLSRFKNSPTPALQSPAIHSNFNIPTINTSDSVGLPSITLRHQKIKRKSIISTTEPSLFKDNDVVRGMKKAEYDDPVPESTNSKKKNSTTTGTSFSRIFRIRSKSIDIKKSPLLPSIPPFVLSDEIKKFELPPLPLLNIGTDLEIAQLQKPKEIQPEPILTKNNYNSTTSKAINITANTNNIGYINNYNNYNRNNDSTTAIDTRFSTTSTRKSSGSYSIYSTFGSSDSIHYGDNDSGTTTSNSTLELAAEPKNKKNSPQTQPDLLSIVTNNLQLRTQARVVPNAHLSSENETDTEDEDEDDDESVNEDVFVDATSFTQEELEKEKIASRLSKRLSGGHFGSAGGLMASIMSVTTADNSIQHHNNSRSPPEDVAKSMLDWKRKSGQGLNAFSKDIKQEITSITEADESNTDENNDNVEEESLQASSPLTASPVLEKPIRRPSPSRPLPPLPNIVLIDDKADGEQAAKDTAAKLWNEVENFVQRERIAEWLGQSKPLNTKTLTYYMNYFDFAKLRVDSAFRKLCSKLYFKAEAQQIDRILESFAKRYWECNRKTIFGSIDIVYAVVYSLLLLNTDLHVAQGNYTRMTRNAFVKNTMSTIRDQQAALGTKRSQSYTLAWESNVESYLKDLYTSVKHNQILQPNTNQNDLLNHSVEHNMSLQKPGGKRINEFKRGLNTMIQRSTSIRESILSLDEPTPRKSTSSAKTNFLHSPRRRSFSSIHSAHSPIPLSPSSPSPFLGGEGVGVGGLRINGKALSSPNQNTPIMQFMDTHGTDLFTNRPPYIKEGVVMRKHLLISANQKVKHREWKECLLVVGQGELNMYSLQGSNNATADNMKKKAVIRASSASFTNLADSLYKHNSQNQQQSSVSFGGVSQHSKGWAEYSQPLDSVKLNHTLSNALPPPGYNRNRPHVFALQESNGGVYLFQTASYAQLSEWVMTCNYWAARQSKEPLPGGIGNLEYGWGACLYDVILDLDAVENNKKVTGNYINNPDSVHLSHWAPPAPTMVSSTLSEKDHFDVLEKYLVSLNQEINEHREIKKKLLVKFPPKCQNYQRALTNWESKSNHLLHEIIKYQNYCNMLEESIVRQAEEKLELINMSTDSILSV